MTRGKIAQFRLSPFHPEIQKATDWQPHTVRGFVSGTLTKKMALKVESFKRENGDRAYRIAQ